MSDECRKFNQLGKGISCPARYKLLEALMSGPKTVNELVSKVKLSQPAVSQHLATLKSCELVESVKKGQEVFYTLNSRYMLELLKKLTSGVSKSQSLAA